MGNENALFPKFSLAERDRRWRAVRALMREAGIDAIVVPNNTGHSTDFQANVRYLTHVGGGGDADIAAVFPLEAEPTAVANRAKINWHTGAQEWIADVREGKRNYVGPVVDRLRELKLERGRIGVTGLGPGTRTPMGTILLGFWQQLRDAFPQADFVDATAILDRIRYVKSEEEVAVLAKSQEIIEKGVDAMVAAARPGARDWEVWAEVMGTLLKHGSELPVHNQWASGKNAKEPMTRPTMRTLERGDSIVSEIEASWIGYRGQAYQPVYVGVADPAQRELIKLQRDIYGALMEKLKPGTTVGELAALTESACAKFAPKSGVASNVSAILNMHGRGQGDDGPLITPSQRRPEQLKVPLQENMVFILKPFIRTSDKTYECCWGDTVVVTPSGGCRLGKRPHDLAVAE